MACGFRGTKGDGHTVKMSPIAEASGLSLKLTFLSPTSGRCTPSRANLITLSVNSIDNYSTHVNASATTPLSFLHFDGAHLFKEDSALFIEVQTITGLFHRSPENFSLQLLGQIDSFSIYDPRIYIDNVFGLLSVP